MTQQKTPGLGQATLQIGDVHVRNRVTIGGILIHSDPRADYPGVVLAIETIIVAQGKQACCNTSFDQTYCFLSCSTFSKIN